MPFRKLPRGMRPKRKGTGVPLFYNGTLEEAEALTEEEVAKALKQTDLEFDDGEHALRVSRTLRNKMIDQMRSIEDSGRKAAQIFTLKVPGGKVDFKLSESKGRFVMHQHLARHRLTKLDTYSRLKKILSEGFKGRTSPNVLVGFPDSRKAYSMADKVFKTDPVGDSFHIKIATPYDDTAWDNRAREATIKYAPPEQIAGVTIILDCGNGKLLPRAHIEKKKAFYRKDLERFGIPISFKEKRYV